MAVSDGSLRRRGCQLRRLVARPRNTGTAAARRHTVAMVPILKLVMPAMPTCNFTLRPELQYPPAGQSALDEPKSGSVMTGMHNECIRLGSAIAHAIAWPRCGDGVLQESDGGHHDSGAANTSAYSGLRLSAIVRAAEKRLAADGTKDEGFEVYDQGDGLAIRL